MGRIFSQAKRQFLEDQGPSCLVGSCVSFIGGGIIAWFAFHGDGMQKFVVILFSGSAGAALYYGGSFLFCLCKAPSTVIKNLEKEHDELKSKLSQYPQAHFGRFRELLKIQISKANQSGCNLGFLESPEWSKKSKLIIKKTLGSNAEWNYHLIAQAIESPQNLLSMNYQEFTINCRNHLERLLNDAVAEDMRQFDLNDPDLRI